MLFKVEGDVKSSNTRLEGEVKSPKTHLEGNIRGGQARGSTDYEELTNKPSINEVELIGNKSSSDLDLQDELVSGENIKTLNNESLLGESNGQVSTIVSSYATINEAKNKYHTILSFAAVSNIERHSACILNEKGETLVSESFRHSSVEE